MTSTQEEVLEVLDEFFFQGNHLPGSDNISSMNSTVHELDLFDLEEKVDLSRKEENNLQLILHEYFNPGAMKEEEVAEDFLSLRDINTQIKSIHAQSIMLHGERIKLAQDILKKYRDGAFTAWLVETYGNRQTPYSILQYCEFYHRLPNDHLRRKLEQIPRKAAYTLASREGDSELKEKILSEHSDAGQKELIMLIQDTFPLPEGDRRKRKEANMATLGSLEKLCQTLGKRKHSLTDEHREKVEEIIDFLQDLLS